MKKQVLVVDDSRMMELQICKLLEGPTLRWRHTAKTVRTPSPAMKSSSPTFVTMDIIMPGIDGLETAKIILEEHPDAPDYHDLLPGI